MPTSAPATSGHTRSFEREALPHLDTMRSYALRLLAGDHARADDAVQDAILRAFRSWHTYTQGTNCRAWLLTILRNVVLSGHAGDARERQRDEALMFEGQIRQESADDAADEHPLGQDVDPIIREAFDRLPRLSREAIVLKEIRGLAYDEIAHVLEVPLGTVKSRLFRARQSLQAHLYDYAVGMGYVRANRSSTPPRLAAAARSVTQSAGSLARRRTHRDRLSRVGARTTARAAVRH